MTTSSWAEKARTSPNYQNTQSRHLITMVDNLLTERSTPEDAAAEVARTLDPFLQQDTPKNQHVQLVWSILCDAIRAEGSNENSSKLLGTFLKDLSTHEVKKSGETVKGEWGGKIWSDMPGWALAFREYGIDVQPPEDENDTTNFLAQATPYLNATVFAATQVEQNQDLITLHGSAFYIAPTMEQALQPPDPDIDPRVQAQVYVPAAVAWMRIAGRTIWAACKDQRDTGSGRLDRNLWERWKEGFGRVADDQKLERAIRKGAGEASEVMKMVEREG